MQLLVSSLGLRSHGTGRICLRSHGPTLTVRKFRPLAAQISVWTDRKYWTVPREQSVCQIFQPVEIRPIPNERSHDVAQNSLPTRSHSPVCLRCSQADVSPSPWSRQP